MREIDWQERKIVIELVKNARISDNEISRRTRIPLKTVNRKRKKLEEEGLLYYFTHIDNSSSGTGLFRSRKLYIVKLKKGMLRQKILEAMLETKDNNIFIKNIFESYIGEVDGHNAVFFVIESSKEHDIVEIYNSEIIPEIERLLGDCIESTQVIGITTPIRMMHNYLPLANMEKGTIKEDFSNDKIFVG